MEFCLEALNIALNRWAKAHRSSTPIGVVQFTSRLTCRGKAQDRGDSMISCLVEGAGYDSILVEKTMEDSPNIRRCTCAPTAMAGKP